MTWAAVVCRSLVLRLPVSVSACICLLGSSVTSPLRTAWHVPRHPEAHCSDFSRSPSGLPGGTLCPSLLRAPCLSGCPPGLSPWSLCAQQQCVCPPPLPPAGRSPCCLHHPLLPAPGPQDRCLPRNPAERLLGLSLACLAHPSAWAKFRTVGVSCRCHGLTSWALLLHLVA